MPISYTRDDSGQPPRLRLYLNLMALDALPDWSKGPHTHEFSARFTAIRDAGYDGVQFVEPMEPGQRSVCEKLGLGVCGSGRINTPVEAAPLAERLAGEGMECATVHVGWGTEDDLEAARLIEAVLNASSRHRFPLYSETHRATIFQDMWRTVNFLRTFPDLRFNIDMSHWYTGQEMVYGGFANKLRFIAPVLERAAFLHGRIGNPGCMQVDLDDANEERHPYVSDFRQMWKLAFEGFLRAAKPGDYICFAPELLAPGIYYARTFPETGLVREESDRWTQSLLLCEIAKRCFRSAQEKVAGA